MIIVRRCPKKVYIFNILAYYIFAGCLQSYNFLQSPTIWFSSYNLLQFPTILWFLSESPTMSYNLSTSTKKIDFIYSWLNSCSVSQFSPAALFWLIWFIIFRCCSISIMLGRRGASLLILEQVISFLFESFILTWS